MSSNPEERELIRRALCGDNRAFDKLVEKIRPVVYRRAVSSLRDLDKAEDIAQETMLRAFTKLHTFRQDCRFSTWVYSICSRCILMHIRSEKRRPAERLDDMSPTVLESQIKNSRSAIPTQEEAYAVKAMVESIDKAISRLGLKYNQVITLWAQGLDLRQISEVTDSSIPATKSRIFRARDKIKSSIGGLEAA